MFSVEHASSMVRLQWRRGGGRGAGEQQASCLVAKQAMEFPQVPTSMYIMSQCSLIEAASMLNRTVPKRTMQRDVME